MNKKRFLQKEEISTGYHEKKRFSRIKVRANKFLIGGLTRVHTSIVIEVIKTISSLFFFLFFFLRKELECTKTPIKQKPNNKIKINKH